MRLAHLAAEACASHLTAATALLQLPVSDSNKMTVGMSTDLTNLSYPAATLVIYHSIAGLLCLS